MVNKKYPNFSKIFFIFKYIFFLNFVVSPNEKSRIQETKHLLTDADSSTDTTVGWLKNTQKPVF